ncbi:MAG TPA: SGNH/GDSL hydrolase family protein [Abditibacteriaceae bacterium]|jgi:hypothetical protein
MDKKKKRVLIGLGVFGVLLVSAEVVARSVLGFGDPPLSMADPQIEYLFKPSATYRRFGNVISFNRYSMRSEDFPRHKTNPRELRIMMIGDSVINGGAQTDQNELASRLLEKELSAALKRPVVVGNISAGSWGPPNQLAYVKRFGFFDADMVVFVFSSHDYSDVPTFIPIVGIFPDFPEHKPLSALHEIGTRYLPRIMGVKNMPEFVIPESYDSAKNPAIAMAALRQLLVLSRKTGARVLLAQHAERAELKGKFKTGHGVISKAAQTLGVPVFQLSPKFKQAISQGKNPYRDHIHPNPLGQRLIADTLKVAIISQLKAKQN